MESKEEEKDVNTDKPGKYEEETEVSPDKEKKEDKGGKEEAASIDSPLRLSDPSTFRPPDSLTDIDASIQKTNLNSLQAVVEIEHREASEPSQELDVGLQLDDTGQVTEYHLDDKEVKESNERASKANKLWNCCRNMWTAPRDTQSNDIEEKEVKHKAPDEARKPAKEEMFETDALRLEG